MFDINSLLTITGAATFLLLVNQVLKTWFVDSKITALLSMLIGVVLVNAVVAATSTITLASVLSASLTGFVAGATASGLFEAGRALFNPRV